MTFFSCLKEIKNIHIAGMSFGFVYKYLKESPILNL